jgi:hypothetical protein
MRVAHGDRMVARETRSEKISGRKKSARFLTTCAEVTTFLLLRHAPLCACACDSRKTASFKMSEGLHLTKLATGNPNLGPYRPENENWTMKIQIRLLVPFQMKRSLYYFMPVRIIGRAPARHTRICRRDQKKETRKGGLRSTVLVTALGSWGKPVPRRHQTVVSRCPEC